LMAGLATIATSCGTKEQPAVAQTPKFRPVDDSEPAGGADATVAPAGDFAAAHASNPLRSQNAAPPPGPTPGGQASPNRTAGATSKASAAEGDTLMSVLEQLDGLARQRPRGNSQEAMLEDFIRIH